LGFARVGSGRLLHTCFPKLEMRNGLAVHLFDCAKIYHLGLTSGRHLAPVQRILGLKAPPFHYKHISSICNSLTF